MVAVQKREILNITSREAKAFQGATPAQISRAEQLILGGKAGAVSGDPILQPIVNTLSALGVRSAASRKFKADATRRFQEFQERERQRIQNQLDITQKKGVIFLTKKELEARGISEGKARVLSTQEQEALKNIKLAERILGKKDTGTGFILGEEAKNIKADKAIQLQIKRFQTKERERKKRLEKIFKDKKVSSVGTIRGEIQTIKSLGRQTAIFGLAALSSSFSNIQGLRQVPSAVKTIFTEVKKDPKLIIKTIKGVPSAITRGGRQAIEFFRISPTEAIGRVAGDLLFFAGTGKALKLVGKIGKVPTSAIKKALRGKKGTKVQILGTQSIEGNKIITKIVFSKGKRKLGGAIGTSVVKGNKVITQVVGKTGKITKVTKKFKQKEVFVGREISVSRSQRSKLISQLITLRKGRKLTNVEKRLLVKLRRKSKSIIVTRDIQGILQAGIGRVAQVKGKKFIKKAIKFPSGKIINKKAKGITRKDFISISKVFTKKDLSLIVGKTFSKKKELTEFIALIKGTSKKSLRSFSISQQQQLRKALSQVVGVATASTQKGRTIIPKLSPKAKSLIVKSTGIAIVKSKVVLAKPVLKAVVRQRQVLVRKTKQITKTNVMLRKKQKLLTKQSQKIQQKTKTLLKQKQSPKTKQKLKQLSKQKSRTRQRQKLLQKQRSKLNQRQRLITKQIERGDPRRPKVIIIPSAKIVGLIKKKKKRKKKVKKRKRIRQGFNVFSRPTRVGKGKKRKLVKLNRVPLTKTKARDLGSFVTDKSLARTFVVKKTKAKQRKPKLRVPARHFSRTKKKFRSFKIVKGKRVQLKRTKIEKRKHLLDTRSEKKGITLKRKLAILQKESKRRPLRRTVKRKATPQQLKNLAKGRKMLATKRKRK